MTIVLSTPPYQQFYDLNGDPLSGGKVYTYLAGTTTPTATYTDQGGGTPSANPIILDSAGRAVWWLDNGVSYKYIVKDSLDNTIKTVDTVIPFTVAASSISTIAANTIVGNNTGATASPFALTVTETTAMLNNVVGDSGSGGTKGLVPAPAAGDAAAGKFLKASGAFVALPFTASFTSSDQTVTSAGLLTLAHGLGAAPKFVQFEFICQSADSGYSTNDVVVQCNTMNMAANLGFACYTDSTNVYIRYGSATPCLEFYNKGTGATAVVSANANWKLRVKAWA